MIRLGYAGSNTLLPSASRTFKISNYTEERMLQTATENIKALRTILEWNMSHQIILFRITSGLVPFASNPINTGSWKSLLKDNFSEIGAFIKKNNISVSFHPGQYTILNSPYKSIYEAALRDLEYHTNIIELMGLPDEAKMIIHCGGKYGNKERSMRMFVERQKRLCGRIKNRLVIENDENTCNAEDIFKICTEIDTPCVLDVFHHEILQAYDRLSIRQIIEIFRETWGGYRQKIHYSNQDPYKRKGAHSATVDVRRFTGFYEQIKDMELDIMLEVKDKQNSILKLRKAYPELK